MLLFVLQAAVAQDESASIQVSVASPDTVARRQTGEKKQPIAVNVADTVPNRKNSTAKRIGDPMKATMMSAVFPGGGQILNRKYWKLPIVYAGFGELLYAIKTNSDNYQMFYKGYVDFTDNIKETDSYVKFINMDPATYDPVVHPETHTPANAIALEERMMRMIDYNKRNRDLSIILLGVWYFAQILDANVDASLLNYDVSDNLALKVSPQMFNLPGTYHPAAGMNLRFTMNF
jgi:hypothetical protein